MDDISAAIIAIVVGACVSAVVVAADKRGLRQPPGPPMTFPARAFEEALRTPGTGWFRKKLRCDRKSFLRIYELVRASWRHEPDPNCKHKLIKRVALTMMYLAQGGTMDPAASALGISRSRGVVYINETLVVLSAMARKFVVMPSADETAVIEEGFFATAGFPGTVGAVDGTLVRIARPHDFEGWYCRKNFPAVNVQAIVDHCGLFRSISIRSGSNNDQSLWNGSAVRKCLSSFIPPGKHLVADAGYKIWGHMLTPFSEADAVEDRRKRVYNLAHSRTLMVVECAFGRLKNRFRVLLGKVEQKSSATVCNVIIGCVVLHNLLTIVQDNMLVDGDDPLLHFAPASVADDPYETEQPISHQQGITKRDDIADILAVI
ncbi:hypothetical protein PF008_g1465 [Phytophthora fragariae]|uniref:DDE Tnp4 domain-containing protein n=1 Tax=Phytophthora fragariae TaxID=53985 RepID=A0A6G0SL20_9STRA|nr:hypothetical protein PF008_g1465 [Phytophthora fragariae]